VRLRETKELREGMRKMRRKESNLHTSHFLKNKIKIHHNLFSQFLTGSHWFDYLGCCQSTTYQQLCDFEKICEHSHVSL